MFLRKKKNKTGSISVQIISKARGKYQVVKTIGSGSGEQEIQKLLYLGKQEIERLRLQAKFFVSESDSIVDSVFDSLNNASVRTVGPEIIFGSIFDHIGFNAIGRRTFQAPGHSQAGIPIEQIKDRRLLVSLSRCDTQH